MQLLFQPYKHTRFYINSCHDIKHDILAKIHLKFKVKAKFQLYAIGQELGKIPAKQ